MKSATIIFPHQLFKINPALEETRSVFMVEEFLFFKQYPFHKQKIILHRASMKFFKDFLEKKGYEVFYIDANEKNADIRNCLDFLYKNDYHDIHITDPTDYLLKRRIQKSCEHTDIKITFYENPNFINSTDETIKYFAEKKHFHQTDFYIQQRKKLDILLDENKNPLGGKWSHDAENRRKLPKDKLIPSIAFPQKDNYIEEAIAYTKKYFNNNLGQIITPFENYPWAWTHQGSEDLLDDFIQQRFNLFGDFEDAIEKKEYFLFHSILTPMLNIGLLSPMQIINKILSFSKNNTTPINSLEGFVRQIIGWREFIRSVYEMKGSYQRKNNFWNFKRKIPQSFYNGTTGITPIDDSIKKILHTGYAHHIDRLMILGNFFLLCEFDPNEVHQWFMELFIDAYDWVMVPNIYGMTQFADGGLMTTKPYISGSNYIFKMSNYKKENNTTNIPSWNEIWDGLFWHFMNKQRDFFLSNPRLGMLVKTFDKMSDVKKNSHLNLALFFLNKIDLENEKTME